MAMPQFKLHQPTTMEQALDLLGQHRTGVMVLAGGTDLVPRLRAGVAQPRHVVSINRVQGIRRLSFVDEDGLVIGAGCRLAEVAADPAVIEHYPALARACSVMATMQVRNQGTVAGNLANAAPSADTAAPLLVYQASLVLVERGGRRQVKLEDFFTGPGATVAEPMEMIEAIRVPAPPMRNGSAYERISARSQVDIAAVGVAAAVNLDMEGMILGARLALAAVAPTPVRCPEAEQMLIGQPPVPEVVKRAAAACVRSAKPIDDVRATAAWRRAMVQALAERALLKAAEDARAKGVRV